MARQIVWNEQGRNELRALSPRAKRAVRRSLRDIDAIWGNDVKQLQGHGERYSLRVDNYRVILLQVGSGDRFQVEKIARRDEVYDDYPLPEEQG